MSKLTAQPAISRENGNASRALWILLASVGVTVLLYTVPYGHTVAYPLLLISTLVHELGHGVAALLVGGSFSKFVMYPDASGVATIGGLSTIGFALSAAGGLVGPAVGAAIGLVCARRPISARWFLGALGVALVLAELLVVRNLFGLFFVGVFAAICLLIAFRGGAQLAQLFLVFLSVQLALSVFSRGDYLFTQYADTAEGRSPSDVQQIAEAMIIAPYWFWGAVCGALSVVALLAGSWYFLRQSR